MYETLYNTLEKKQNLRKLNLGVFMITGYLLGVMLLCRTILTVLLVVDPIIAYCNVGAEFLARFLTSIYWIYLHSRRNSFKEVYFYAKITHI